MNGTVHIFIGQTSSESGFYQYFERSFTPDGDMLNSKFMEDFGIDWNESESQEIHWQAEDQPAKKLVVGCSYVDQFLHDLPDMNGNCMALLYNSSPPHSVSGKHGLQYVGTYGWKH